MDKYSKLTKFVVVSASALMVLSLSSGVLDTSANASNRNSTKAVGRMMKRSNKHNHKNKLSIKGKRTRKSLKSRKPTSHHSKRTRVHAKKRGKSPKSNFSRQYKQGFDVSKYLDFAPSTYFGFHNQDEKYYNSLHHPMTKAYKQGFLKGAEKAGRTSALEGAGFAIYHPSFRRKAFKHAHKTAINSLNAWKYSLKHGHNHDFNLGEKAELSLIGNGSSIPKSLKHLKHNRNFKNGWITAYDYTLGISLKSNRLSNGNYNSYIK